MTLTPAGNPYTGTSTIEPGVTVVVEPGVEFSSPVITVAGTLLAQGTAEKPIVFKGTSFAAVTFQPGSGASVLDHAEVIEAGSAFSSNAQAAIEVHGSSPTITNSTIRKPKSIAITVTEGGSPEIADNYIVASPWTGISYGAGAGKTGEVNIHDNLIEGGAGGISVQTTGSTVAGGTLSGNTVVGGLTISFEGPDIPGNITQNTAARIEIGGTVAHSSVWKGGGPPVTMKGGGIAVAAGVNLEIQPGIEFSQSRLTVAGTLTAQGTAEKPIVFKGNTYAVVTFQPGSGASVLDHAEVIEGGSAFCCGNAQAAIEVRGSSPTITNSTIRKSKSTGIAVKESGAPRVERNRFRSNPTGLLYEGAGKLSVPNNDWGCASGPRPAGCGDPVASNVEWKPAAPELPELAGHCRGKESQCGEGADPVSLATGQLSYSHRDLALPNKSADLLEFARSYSSGSTTDAGLGPGWSQTGLASATELAGKEVLIVRQDGRQDLFQKTESGYSAPSGVTDTLAKVEGIFQLTTLEGTVYRFDASGRIASITDSHNLKTTYAYSAEGRLATITDPSAQTLSFAYNGTNHITSVKDSTGREVKFGYSAAGDLETVTDPLAGVTKYGYDAQHRLTSITDPRGNVILKNTYSGEGKIVEQRDGLENLWKLEYKAGETIVTEPAGGKLKYGFDGQGRVVSETDQLGNVTTIDYDAAGNVSEVLQPGGAKWVFGHDAAGNLTSVKDPEGGEREYEYNAQNRPSSFTDARGNSWSYEWSGAGDLLKTVDPEGGETTATYNASGQPLTSTDPNNHKSEFAWDTRGNQLSVTDPLGHKTSFEYDSRSYLIAKTLPGLKAEKLERDALGDLLARTTPEGHKTKYAYDKNGLPIQVTDPGENVWKIERNAMERPTAYVDPLEQQEKVSYNGNLKPVKVVDRRGKETTYGYDLANRLTEVDGPEGGDWLYGYDTRGNRSSLEDPLGHETFYEYDLLNRMVGVDQPLGVSAEYGYDADGDLTSIIDPRGNATEFAYDKLGRLTEVAQPLGKTTTYGYDPAGNRVAQTTAAGTLEYGHDAADRLTKVSAGESTLRSLGYDAANRLTSATDQEGHKIEIGRTEEGLVSSINDGRGQSLTRAYNSRGLLSKQVDPRGTLEYGYDKLGRMISLTDPQGKALGFGYDPEGDLTEVTRPSGVTTKNVFDEAGRLAETTSVTGEPPTTLESLAYGYDAAGEMTGRLDRRLEEETTYGYDALGRMTDFDPPGEGSTAYGYDKAGNRTEAGGTTYTYNALNQLTEASDGTTYGYDGAGRMTGRAKGAEEVAYEWNLLDQLIGVEGPGGIASYAYDGLERLSERKGEAGTSVFHYGGLTDPPTYLANGAGETTTSYVQGAPGLVEQRSGGSTAYPLADAHGDVTAIAGPGGEVESRQSYGPWGEQLSGPGIEMGYLGAFERPTNPTSGLIQMGARSYDPSLGRFLSEDPVLGHMGVGISTNRYPYVWDDPLNRYDLNGRDVCLLGACAEEAAGGIADGASGFANSVKHEIEKTWGENEEAASGAADAASTAGRALLEFERRARERELSLNRDIGSFTKTVLSYASTKWETCGEGARAGAPGGFIVGAFFGPEGLAPGAAIGGAAGCLGTVGAESLLESQLEP